MKFAATTSALLVGMVISSATNPLSAASPDGCTEFRVTTAAMADPKSETTRSPSGEPYGILSSCHFQVFYAERLPAEHVVFVTDLLEQTHTLFYRSLGDAGFKLKSIEEPLHCRFFETRDAFDRYAWETERQRLPWLDSYYSPRTNRVALLLAPNENGDDASDEHEIKTTSLHGVAPAAGHHPEDFHMRIAHEAAHQLAFNSGLQKRGVMYPFWVAEGLAASFETDSRLGPGTPNPARSGHLVKAWQEDRLRSFDDFLITVEPACRTRKELNDLYAQAWGVFHYLFTHHPVELQEYLARLAESRPGRRSTHARRHDVTAALPPLDELRDGWHHYLNGLQEMQPVKTKFARNSEKRQNISK